MVSLTLKFRPFCPQFSMDNKYVGVESYPGDKHYVPNNRWYMWSLSYLRLLFYLHDPTESNAQDRRHTANCS